LVSGACGHVGLRPSSYSRRFGTAGAISDAMIRYPDRPEGEMGRRFAEAIPPDSVAFQVDASGMTSYLSDRTVINGDGLMNNMEYQKALRAAGCWITSPSMA